MLGERSVVSEQSRTTEARPGRYPCAPVHHHAGPARGIRRRDPATLDRIDHQAVRTAPGGRPERIRKRPPNETYSDHKRQAEQCSPPSARHVPSGVGEQLTDSRLVRRGRPGPPLPQRFPHRLRNRVRMRRQILVQPGDIPVRGRSGHVTTTGPWKAYKDMPRQALASAHAVRLPSSPISRPLPCRCSKEHR